MSRHIADSAVVIIQRLRAFPILRVMFCPFERGDQFPASGSERVTICSCEHAEGARNFGTCI